MENSPSVKKGPSLMDLPDEIVEMIILFLSHEDKLDNEPSENRYKILQQNHLVSLCRASKRLYELVLPHLYQVAPLFPGNIILLANTMYRRPDLGPLIKQLYFDFPSIVGSPSPPEHKYMYSHAHWLIGNRPNRESHGYVEHILAMQRFTERLMQFFLGQTPNLEVLDLRLLPNTPMIFAGDRPRSDCLRKIRLNTPPMEYCEIGVQKFRWLMESRRKPSSWEISDECSFFLQPPPYPQYDFEVEHLTFRDFRGYEVLSLLPELKTLTCYGSERSCCICSHGYRFGLQEYVLTCKKTLESLSFYGPLPEEHRHGYFCSEAQRRRSLCFKFMKEFEVLQHLTIPTHVFDPEFNVSDTGETENSSDLGPLLMNLPQSIRTLTLHKTGRASNSQIFWLAGAFSDGLYPNLEEVTIRISSREDDVPGLRAAYRRYGLKLTVTNVETPGDVLDDV